MSLVAEAADIQEAEEAYRAGDCKTAIEWFTQIISEPDASDEIKSVGLFKIAYCYYSDGKFAQAENAFFKSLTLDPKNAEAQFRYLDSVFQQGKWKKVILYAQKLSFHAQRNEILLMAGRAYLESHEPEKALEQFHQMNPSPDLLPSQQYWMGVAEFQRGDQNAAMNRFQYAMGGAFAPDWVRSYSQDWLNALRRDSNPIYGALTLGYFDDGNVGSYSLQPASFITGLPNSVKANSASYLMDHGYLANLRLGGTWHEAFPWKLVYLLDYSSPFYSKYSAYNNQNIGLEIRAQYVKSSKEKYQLSVRYLDSRFRYLYYQDYLILTPGMSWTPKPRLTFTFDLPITRYIVTRTATLIGPLANARYQWFPWLSVNAGLNVAKAIGESAIYSGRFLTSGTAFSNYQTVGGTLGFSAELPFGFYLSSQASIYKTTYDDEAVTFFGNLINPGPRKDTLTVLYADLYKPITDRWAIDLAFHFYSNESSGFQGIATSNETLVYSYQKPYWLLSNTIQF